MRRAMILFALAGLAIGPGLIAAEDGEFTDEFGVDDCEFSDTGRNPYFSITPGDRLILESEEVGESVRVQITVLQNRRWIHFRTADGDPVSVRARVVEEREWLNGAIIEISRNYYARCTQTNDIHYFGEEVDIYDRGRIVSHAGAWRAGVNEARPGVIMPGSFLLGSRYYQEVAADVALDRAENVRMGFEVSVEAGDFEDCVEVTETSPLEPGHESIKIYCEDVGLVADNDAELANFNVAGYEDKDDEDDD